MTRHLILIGISICGVLLAPLSGLAQLDQERCFPWQELRDGACTAKAAPAATQSRQLTTTPRDDPPPAAAPVTPAPPRPPAPAAAVPPAAAPKTAIRCDGGTATGGTCTCPAGYTLLPAATGGGTCVRRNAENCRGGALTATGICLCDGRVTMSGEVYRLEFLDGQCVPKHCPDKTYLKDGKCVASNDTRFSFTCRTGYIPDDSVPGTAATGLRCVPDPAYCPPEAKRRDGGCTKTSAIPINCFENRCTCGPNAEWASYLCECTAPYSNVNGTCVTASTASVGQSSKPELQSTDPAPRRRACSRWMVRTRSGKCVSVRRRLQNEFGVFHESPYRHRYFPAR